MALRLHPRWPQERKAGNDIRQAICDIAEKSDLTPAEIVRILLNEAASWHVYVLRAERHPDDPEKKADEE